MALSDCVVIGAGPAGLAASAALTDRGVDHVVLERGLTGQSWRTQRWETFRLNTPGWMNGLLGEQPRDAYADATQVVTAIADLGRAAPVHEHRAVTRLTPDGAGFALQTSDGDVGARCVVVAAGDQNVPVRPAPHRRLPDWIAQIHAGDYRSPTSLPVGAILLVGSGQTGCQIAEDLIAAGRRVLLSTSRVGRVPSPYRGRNSFEWLAEAGFFDQRPMDLPDLSMINDPQPVIAAGGRSLSLQSLARRGVILLGRAIEIEGDLMHFGGNATDNVAAGDAAADRIRGMIDQLIKRTGISAPPPSADDSDLPVRLDPPTTVDLRAEDVSTVIWCSGFSGDFCWLDPGLRIDGLPQRSGFAGSIAGLWYIGQKWLTRRRSGLLYGMPDDAAAVADAVRRHLDSAARPA